MLATALGITAKAITWTTVTLATVAWVSSIPPVVEFNTEPAGAAFDQVDTAALAQSYAAQHGLTDCTEPADADLDDVFLTLASDLDGNPTTDRIRPVDLDTALDSAGKRLVLLACDKEQS